MAYQLSDLITSVQQRAKDTSFSSSLITEYLNEVQNEVLGHRRYTFMETTDTDTLANASNEIVLADDVQVVEYLALVIDGTDHRLTYIPRRQFDEGFQATSSGQPANFTFYGRSIFFSSDADQSYTVSMKYLRRPTALVNDTDVPDVPEDYRELLVRGALARVEEYRENYDIAAIHNRKVEELSEDMNLRYGLRQLITAPRQPRRSFRSASL